MGARGRTTDVGVEGRWVRCGSTANAGGKGIGAGRSAKVLTITATSSAERTSSRCVGTGTGSAANRVRAHAVVGTAVHGRWVARVGDNSGTSTAGTTSQTADVLGKVVVSADLVTALPITSSERDDTAAAHTTSAMTTHATMVMVVTAVVRGRHHRRSTVAVAGVTATATASTIASHLTLRATSTDSWERTAEASSSPLEIRKATRGASPITRTRAVLARREGRQDLCGSIENSAGRRGDLDGLLVQSTSVHTEALGSLISGLAL